MTEIPDISAFASGSGAIPFVHRLDSGAAGPTVVVNALTHGNEIAGAAVAQRLIAEGPRPQAGTLIVVFANYRGYASVSPVDSGAGRMVDRDLNRVWDPALLSSSEDSWETARARELLPVYQSADALLDIHTTATDDPPFIIAFEKPATSAFLRLMPLPQRRVLMPEAMHHGTLLVEAGEFSNPQSHRVAIVAECGFHRSPHAASLAWSVTLDFMRAAGTIGPSQERTHSVPPRYFRMRRAVVPTQGDFRFTTPLVSFASLPGDQPFAIEGGLPLTPGFGRAVLLMPRKRPSVGAEAGFLAQEVEFETG